MIEAYDVYMCRGSNKRPVRMCDIRWINHGWMYGHAGSTPYKSFCKKAIELGFSIPKNFEETYDLYMSEMKESVDINRHKKSKKPSWLDGLVKWFTSY